LRIRVPGQNIILGEKKLRQDIICSSPENLIHKDIPAENNIQVIKKTNVGLGQRKIEHKPFGKQAIVKERHAKSHSQERQIALLNSFLIPHFQNKFMGISIG
jgi:hypothetical protein